ncbi:MAG: mercury transporter MerT [Alphaproteobacteria bacterium]
MAPPAAGSSRANAGDGTSPGLLAAGGVVGGLGAIAGASCCVLPVALAALGVGSGVSSALGALAEARVPMLGGAAAVVVVGWWLWARPRARVCADGSTCATRPRSRRSAMALTAATLIIALAAAWGKAVEPILLPLAGAS